MYKLAINRPIATFMYAFSLLIFGYMSFSSMPSALFPKVDFPIVTITTVYAGAESETIESQVTQKIEEAVSGISGIDKMQSTSANGVSNVIITFLLDRDIDEATNDVRDKVAAVALPKDAKKPLVSKLDIGAAPVIKLFVTAQHATQKELMVFCDDVLKPQLQKIIGVGNVAITGFQNKEIKIFPDPYKLNKYGITIRELQNRIAAENMKMGGGKLITNTQEIFLKVQADATNIADLENMFIAKGIRLKDVAKVQEKLEDAQSYASFGSKQGVLLGVQKISTANTLQVIQAIKDALPTMQKRAGEKYGLHLLQDQSPFIIHSLQEVKFDLIYGAFLAVIIIFVFLRNVTITLVSALSIPTSILGTIALMHFMGYDLNKMTLIGLTLAIGIIIDDAIVVMENIFTKLEEGKSKLEAAFYGVKEMAFAIVAISAMLLAVFLPVANMSGIVGKFFESFAMTVGFAIIISFTIAMSLMPSLSARVLHGGHSKFYHWSEPFFVVMEQAYVKLLRVVLRFKYLTITAIFLLLFASLSLFPKIGMDFIPKEDKSEFEVKIKAPTGISLEAMIEKTQQVEALLKQQKVVDYTSISIGYNAEHEINKAKLYVHLVPIEKRSVIQDEVIQNTRKLLEPLNKELFITVAAIPTIQGAGVSVPYQIVLKSDNFEALQHAAEKLKAILHKKEGFVDIDTDLDEGTPQYNITILRDVSSRYGITAAQIAQSIFNAFSSDVALSYFDSNGKQYDITMRFDDKNRVSIEDIKKIQIRTKSGALILLDGLVKIDKGTSYAAIHHFDRQRAINVFADLHGLDLGGAIAYTMQHLGDVLEKGVSYRFTGFAEEMGKTNKAFGVAFGIAAILMYIILAVLYESLVQPVIIMLTVPLSLAGILIALFLAKMHFSLFVFIGFMLLMGMVAKNGVLIVDFANKAREEGQDVESAIMAAGQERLRPILMTTFAMIFAMIPLALAHGLGSEIKAPMAIAIIGGLISSMVLTLLVIPAFYRIFYPLDMWLRRHYEMKLK